jgi:hypothetical protein
MSVESKILAVMASVGQLAPDSHVAPAAGGYPYLSGDYVTGVLQPLFAEVGLVIHTIEAEILSERDVQIGTKAGVLVRIRMGYRIVDAEDPKSFISVVALGESSDTADKAVSQAQTSAYKQALLRTFMISSAEASEPATSRQRQNPGGKAGEAQKHVVCESPGCGTIVTPGQETISRQKYGKALCPHHQNEAKAPPAGGG